MWNFCKNYGIFLKPLSKDYKNFGFSKILRAACILSTRHEILYFLLYFQVFHIVTKFYGPLPAAIVIERSVNYGKTYQPWQYYAVDCQKSFQLANNGRLSQPDSVNCLQTQRYTRRLYIRDLFLEFFSPQVS